jgi:hypothetical protein
MVCQGAKHGLMRQNDGLQGHKMIKRFFDENLTPWRTVTMPHLELRVQTLQWH